MDKNNDILLEAIDERIDSFIRGAMTEEEEAALKQAELDKKKKKEEEDRKQALWLET